MRVQSTWLLSKFLTQKLYLEFWKMFSFRNIIWRNITGILWPEKESIFCSDFYFFIWLLGVGPSAATVFLEKWNVSPL